MRGAPIVYSDLELSWIKTNSHLSRRQLHKAFVECFGRTDVSKDNIKALCTRQGWQTGRDGRFVKGGVPANKGKKMPFNANSARTQFKTGNKPHNTKHAGYERLSKDGYVEISIGETNPHTGYERRFVQKHRWLWEKENGPVPEGHCLKCLDGDKSNTAPANWEAIPRALLPRLNGRLGRGHDDAPAALKPTIMAVTKLEHAAREKRKGG